MHLYVHLRACRLWWSAMLTIMANWSGQYHEFLTKCEWVQKNFTNVGVKTWLCVYLVSKGTSYNSDFINCSETTVHTLRPTPILCFKQSLSVLDRTNTRIHDVTHACTSYSMTSDHEWWHLPHAWHFQHTNYTPPTTCSTCLLCQHRLAYYHAYE